MKINQAIKSISHFYYKMSNFGKVLLFVTILLILIAFFKSLPASNLHNSILNGKEGFLSNENFLFNPEMGFENILLRPADQARENLMLNTKKINSL